MKNPLIYTLTAAAMVSMAACGDGVHLPDYPCESDIMNIPGPEKEELLIPLKSEDTPMIHNGGTLHSYEDFEYVKAHLSQYPWSAGYEKLCSNFRSNLGYFPSPKTTIQRGAAGENYIVAAKDVAAAYQHALRFRLGDGQEYGDEAYNILRQWMFTCENISGDTNSALGAGIYGYEFAIAGELMRDYWIARDPDEFKRYQQWLIDVFYVVNHNFLEGHFGTVPGHYWANWGLCNIASMAAIGITSDRRDIYNEAITHFQIGETNGCLTKAINHVFDGEWSNMAQWQESGRDVGHVLFCQGLVGVICQICWSQEDDFFGYDDCRFLKGCEYHAAWLTGKVKVPFEPYERQWNNAWGPTTDLLENLCDPGDATGQAAIWAIPYNHYAKIRKLPEERWHYTQMSMQISIPEGGGEGNVSGGYDMLGHGTLMFSRE